MLMATVTYISQKPINMINIDLIVMPVAMITVGENIENGSWSIILYVKYVVLQQVLSTISFLIKGIITCSGIQPIIKLCAKRAMISRLLKKMAVLAIGVGGKNHKNALADDREGPLLPENLPYHKFFCKNTLNCQENLDSFLFLKRR